MSNIETHRIKIDKIDYQIIDLLIERMKVVNSIAHSKKENKHKIYQAERLNFIKKDRVVYAEKSPLNPAFLLKIVELLHEESLNIQYKIFEQQ